MNILVPSQLFLRVREKYCADFVYKDRSVGCYPRFVYVRLFSLAFDTGSVTLPQRELADDMGMSVRALQNALRVLANTGYLHAETTPGQPSTYSLLLSDHVLRQIRKYDLIDNPAWYSRPGGSALHPVETADPPHTVRTTRARRAHPSYNVYKNYKKDTPLPPSLPQTRRMPPRSESGGEGGFSSSGFSRLWDAYPVKKGKESALRAYMEFVRDKDAPALDRLLEIVAAFKAGDDQWRRGYAPYLATWLRERRWDDEILSRDEKTGTSVPVPRATVVTLPPPSSTRVELSPEAEKRLDDVCSVLCGLWPGTNPIPIAAFLRPLAASGALSPTLPHAAKAYLAVTPNPVSLCRWLWLRDNASEDRHGGISREIKSRVSGPQAGNRRAA
jgi:hypothetical protein